MAAGGLLAFNSAVREATLEVLAGLGAPYLATYPEGDSRRVAGGFSEYLVVLSGEVDEATRLDLFARRPDIEYLSASIYPNTHRVALRVPVGEALEFLEAQPSVRFVIKNYPFLFCH
jgi:hypothetical protein